MDEYFVQHITRIVAQYKNEYQLIYPDAVHIDTTNVDIEEVFAEVLWRVTP
jgi:hypothetical protein